jgi:DNA-binding MarR family transcriptional regulator
VTDRPAKRRPDQNEKTDRAFHTYIDLLDAAEYMRARLYDQLTFYDLTMNTFRVMQLLEHEGSCRATAMAERCHWSRQNLGMVVRQLTAKGWVRMELVKANPNGAKQVAVLHLTRQGHEFIQLFLPRHGKVIKALMRALDGREQMTLARLCRKLKEGDIFKFISEMEHRDYA